jgi:hypothetical protein
VAILLANVALLKLAGVGAPVAPTVWSFARR